MKTRIAAATLNLTPLDWPGNEKTIRKAISEARAKEVSILCLPELCLTGYGCEDAFLSKDTSEKAIALALSIAGDTRGIAVAMGLPLRFEENLYNAVLLAIDGKPAGIAVKRNLAGDGIHYEPRWFKPWPKGRRTEIKLGEVSVPLGDYCFDLGRLRLAFEICEEAWVKDRPLHSLAGKVDVVLNPSASHFAFGKLEQRKQFAVEGSRTGVLTYCYANLLGNESGRAIYDGGALVADRGKLLAMTPRLSFQSYQLAVADIFFEGKGQKASGSDSVSLAFSPKEVSSPFPETSLPAWESSRHLKEEEFTRAVSLGLFDYLRKTHGMGFVVSLSGGADSAAVSCLVALMIDLAKKELGEKGFAEKLGIAPVVKDALTCVYQATENNSSVTKDAARQVAKAIGATYFEIAIDKLVNEYLSIVSKATGIEPNWKTHDRALQNVQARVRSPSVWLIANLKNAILLCTSNRSEAAVGYATMDGDTSGGLSPIGAIDKAYLRKWLVWLEKEGPLGAFSVPALAAVNRQAPTAELRPLETGQTDEADLMPYEILDRIERAFVRDKLSAQKILDRLDSEGTSFSRAELAAFVEKFLRLWSHNQWKRERYAPSFHVDDESLDPKTWCRFPILSGNYEEERKELMKEVEKKS